MAFVDELTLDLTAGKGGNGVIRWLHMKGKDHGGPSGGDGGNGGDVSFGAVRDLSILSQYTGSPKMGAEDGTPGDKNLMAGKNGNDLKLDVPVGSVITRHSDNKKFELLQEGHEVTVLYGGRGGYGNAHFKSSKNINPKEQTDGKPGDASLFTVEVRLIADAGFIGLPNAGKSTLLNTLTNAKSEIGNYNFTTLEPHLGTFYGFVLADIPGLIEGASEGKGLGHKFLRHIQRTKMLIHCVSVENEDVVLAYQTIRDELKSFDRALLEKDEVVLLTKSDYVDEETLEDKEKKLAVYLGKDVQTLSVLDDEGVKKFSDSLVRELEGAGK
ncbi:MAG: GTPase ObgE [Candidatus Paceibacterota bacterium]